MSERIVVSREGSERTDDSTMGEAGLNSFRRLVCGFALLCSFTTPLLSADNDYLL